MMTEWLEPFSFEFFRHGFYAAIMVGAVCGLIGVYIVLRGMSYIGHGLAHAAFGGAVLGYVLNVNFYVGAAIAGFVAAVLISQLTQGKKIKPDAAIGIVTTAFFALGVALISRVRQFSQSFDAALFGNILGVTTTDLIVIAVVLILTVLMVFFLYKPLLFSTFDEDTAHIFGIKTQIIQLIFSLMLALSIIASMNIVGVTMIAATLVIPASTVRIVSDHFGRILVVSTVIGGAMGATGMYVSYHLDVASGATIVLVGALMFCIVLFVSWVREKLVEHEHLHQHGSIMHSHPDSHAADHENEHTHSHEGEGGRRK